MDEPIGPGVNPKLRELNERNRAFWDRRHAVEAELLSNPETACYVVENLRAAQFQDSLLREVQGGAAIAASELAKTSADLAKASSELRKIRHGASKRQDQLDRQQFVDWLKTHDIRIERISDLWKMPGFNWAGYRRATLKKWYKAAMPDVELRPGRPQSK